MSGNAKIGIVLESSDAKAKLRELGNSFERLDNSIDEVGNSGKAMGSKTTKALNDIKAAAKGATDATDSNRKALNDFAGKFITFEIAKKVGEFAARTLEAAAANEQITGKTKETALAFVEAKNNVSDIAEGMVLATANIASSAFEIVGLNDLLADTAAAWREIAGLKQQSTLDNDKANAYNLELANLSSLARQYKVSSEEYNKYKKSNIEFANTAKQGMDDLSKAIAQSNEKLKGLGKELDETTISALKNGETTTAQIREGAWEKEKKKREERAERLKQLRTTEINELTAYSNKVRENYGSELDIIERQYEKQIDLANRSKDKRLLSESEYTDAITKALEARNKAVYDLQKRNDGEDNNNYNGFDGDAAKAAQLRAEEQAKVKLEAEKKLQSDLYTLRLTSANSETERLQIEREQITQHYQELTNQYQSSAEMLVEIDKAKNKELADNSNKIAEIEQANRKASIDTFLNGYNSLFSYLAGQNLKWAVAAKSVAVTQATINTLEGVTKAFAQGGLFGIISGAGALASGLATVAQIKNQKFAAGGIVSGNSYVGDYVPVRANSGEMILNQSQQAQLFKMANNQSVGNSSPVNLTINVSGSSAVDVKKMLFENRNELNKMVASALNNRNINSVGVAL